MITKRFNGKGVVVALLIFGLPQLVAAQTQSVPCHKYHLAAGYFGGTGDVNWYTGVGMVSKDTTRGNIASYDNLEHEVISDSGHWKWVDGSSDWTCHKKRIILNYWQDFSTLVPPTRGAFLPNGDIPDGTGGGTEDGGSNSGSDGGDYWWGSYYGDSGIVGESCTIYVYLDIWGVVEGAGYDCEAIYNG